MIPEPIFRFVVLPLGLFVAAARSFSFATSAIAAVVGTIAVNALAAIINRRAARRPTRIGVLTVGQKRGWRGEDRFRAGFFLLFGPICGIGAIAIAIIGLIDGVWLFAVTLVAGVGVLAMVPSAWRTWRRWR